MWYYYFSFYLWANWGLVRLNNLPKAMQPLSQRQKATKPGLLVKVKVLDRSADSRAGAPNHQDTAPAWTRALNVIIRIVRDRSLKVSLETQSSMDFEYSSKRSRESEWDCISLKLTSSLGMNFTCMLDFSPGSKTPEVGWISKIRVFGLNSVHSFRLKYFGMCFSSWQINSRQLDHFLWKMPPPSTHSIYVYWLLPRCQGTKINTTWHSRDSMAW